MEKSYNNPATLELVKSRYKNEEGEPFILTPGQNEIFDIIVYRLHPRTQAITYTQYGKSDICSLGVLTRATTYPEMWAIVAPSMKKAGIIMGYVIGHIFDNEAIKQQFQIGKDESLERIRRERNKDKLTFRLPDGGIGGVFILSCEGKRVKDVLEAIMGFGAKNIILDESGLISDQHYAGVKRMLGGHKDNFLLEIGNPFLRNHFLRTSRDPRYKHIVIDYRQGIKEGRIMEDFINEMRREAFFSILYDVKFPEEESMDSQGWMPLFTEEELDRAYVDKIDIFGSKKMGNDVGAGIAKTVSCVRGANAAKFTYSGISSDTMALVGEIRKTAESEAIEAGDISIDRLGPGQGAYNRLVEVMGLSIVGVAFGESPENEEDFSDRRAQMYWRSKQWLSSGGKLVRHPGWEELLNIKYKVQSDRKVRIKSKEEMAKDGIVELDHADAFVLTFATEKKKRFVPIQYRPHLKGYGGRR